MWIDLRQVETASIAQVEYFTTNNDSLGKGETRIQK